MTEQHAIDNSSAHSMGKKATNKDGSAKNDNLPTVSALLLHLTNKTLLVPNIALAELALFKKPKSWFGAPPWVLGLFEWRGLDVPLLSLEIMQGEHLSMSTTTYVAVLNAIGGVGDFQFIALLLQQLPVPVHIQNDFPRVPEKELYETEMAVALLNNMEVVIPDLVAVERALHDLHIINIAK